MTDTIDRSRLILPFVILPFEAATGKLVLRAGIGIVTGLIDDTKDVSWRTIDIFASVIEGNIGLDFAFVIRVHLEMDSAINVRSYEGCWILPTPDICIIRVASNLDATLIRTEHLACRIAVFIGVQAALPVLRYFGAALLVQPQVVAVAVLRQNATKDLAFKGGLKDEKPG